MSYADEFQTVDLIITSSAETRGVDAFALSLIKAERQMRKLVTCLVFQYPCFTHEHIKSLKDTLGNNRNVYFAGFEQGFDAIYPHPIRELVGERYPELRERIKKAIDYRNKIFHGQLTGECLAREELLEVVVDIRSWCELVARGADDEIGYDGFARNSFQKIGGRELSARFKIQIRDFNEYRQFIAEYMQRSVTPTFL